MGCHAYYHINRRVVGLNAREDFSSTWSVKRWLVLLSAR